MDDLKTVITKREESAVPAAEANNALGGVTVIQMPAWQIALVRTARVYLQTLVGVLIAGGTGLAGAVGVQMPAGDFSRMLISAASLAVAPAAVTFIQNVIELLAKLDTLKPTLRA